MDEEEEEKDEQSIFLSWSIRELTKYIKMKIALNCEGEKSWKKSENKVDGGEEEEKEKRGTFRFLHLRWMNLKEKKLLKFERRG